MGSRPHEESRVQREHTVVHKRSRGNAAEDRLRADIDEAAWATLYSTRSRPFPRPESGKVAVKVINHYGDEVLKVYEV